MFERFTADARSVVIGAQDQARMLDHCWIGTEHILLALARSRGVAARVLRDFDVDHARLLGATVALLGTAHRDGAPDPRALESIGIDLDAVRRRVEETFGPGALERTSPGSRRRRRGRSGHIPFTGRAKKVLERALRESLALRHGYIGSEHILLAIAADRTALAARVLASLGVDPSAVRQRVSDALEGQADTA